MEVISSDMGISSEMRQDAEKKAKEIFSKEKINEAELCKQIKNYFDEKYGPNWHCVIGKNFYTTFSHEENTFIFINIDQVSLLLFKMG